MGGFSRIEHRPSIPPLTEINNKTTKKKIYNKMSTQGDSSHIFAKSGSAHINKFTHRNFNGFREVIGTRSFVVGRRM